MATTETEEQNSAEKQEKRDALEMASWQEELSHSAYETFRRAAGLLEQGRGLTDSDRDLLKSSEDELRALFGDINAQQNGRALEVYTNAAERLAEIEALVGGFAKDQLPEGKEGVDLKMAVMEKIDARRREIYNFTQKALQAGELTEAYKKLRALWQELSTLSSEIVITHTQSKLKKVQQEAAIKAGQIEQLFAQHRQEVEAVPIGLETGTLDVAPEAPEPTLEPQKEPTVATEQMPEPIGPETGTPGVALETETAAPEAAPAPEPITAPEAPAHIGPEAGVPGVAPEAAMPTLEVTPEAGAAPTTPAETIGPETGVPPVAAELEAEMLDLAEEDLKAIESAPIARKAELEPDMEARLSAEAEQTLAPQAKEPIPAPETTPAQPDDIETLMERYKSPLGEELTELGGIAKRTALAGGGMEKSMAGYKSPLEEELAELNKVEAPPVTAPERTEKVGDEKIKAIAQKIYGKRMSGEISWAGVDAMLVEKGIEPGSDQAKQFMKDWDWQQAEKILRNETPDDLVVPVVANLLEKPAEVKTAPTPEASPKIPEAPEAPAPEEAAEVAAPPTPETRVAGPLERKLLVAKGVLEKANADLAAFLRTAGSSTLDEAAWEKERQTLLEVRAQALAEFEKASTLFEGEAKMNEAKEKLRLAEQALASHLEKAGSSTDPGLKAETEKLMKAEQEARSEYEKVRAGLSANRLEVELEKRMQAADANLEKATKEKSWLEKQGRKIYEFQKMLGEHNLANYLPESWQTKATDTKFWKGVKGTGRFLARMASLRTASSAALLGVGLYTGLGVAGGAAVLGGRKLLSGIATYYGAHDGMKAWRENKDREMGLGRKLTPEELKTMSEDEMMERLGFFEADARMNEKKAGENETYKAILAEMESRMKYHAADEQLDKLLMQAEEKGAEVEKKMKSKARNRKRIAVGVALLAGSSSYWLPQAWTGVKGGWHGVKEMLDSRPQGEELEFGSIFGVSEAHAATLEEAGLAPNPAEALKTGTVAAGAAAVESETPSVASAPVETRPPAEAAPAQAAGTAAKAAETGSKVPHFEYQGGKSIWAEVSRQYTKRFPDFNKLLPAERTYLIDKIKDKFTDDPKAFGLEDPNLVTEEQLRAIDWDKAFADAKLGKPSLSTEQITNIDQQTEAARQALSKPEIVPEKVGTVPETVVTAKPLPEAELKVRPDVKPGPDIKSSHAEVAPSEAAPSPPAEAAVAEGSSDIDEAAPAPEAAQIEATPEKFAAFVASQNAGEKAEHLRAFSSSIESADERQGLMRNPELLQRSFEQFQLLLKDNTDRLKAGQLAQMTFGEPSPVETGDGHVYFLVSPDNKPGQLNILELNKDGQYQKMAKAGFLGRERTVFDAKDAKDLLGYSAKPGTEAVTEAAPVSRVHEGYDLTKWNEKTFEQARLDKHWFSQDGKTEYFYAEGSSKDMQMAVNKAVTEIHQRAPEAQVVSQLSLSGKNGVYTSRVLLSRSAEMKVSQGAGNVSVEQ